MICALMIGRAGSTGFPGKNIYPVLGRPLAAYPLMAARSSRHIKRLYISTDSPEIMEIGRGFGAEFIERPANLATKEALGEDVFVHGYKEIVKRLANEGQTVELMVLLFANAATITGSLIDQGIDALRADSALDRRLPHPSTICGALCAHAKWLKTAVCIRLFRSRPLAIRAPLIAIAIRKARCTLRI